MHIDIYGSQFGVDSQEQITEASPNEYTVSLLNCVQWRYFAQTTLQIYSSHDCFCNSRAVTVVQFKIPVVRILSFLVLSVTLMVKKIRLTNVLMVISIGQKSSTGGHLYVDIMLQFTMIKK